MANTFDDQEIESIKKAACTTTTNADRFDLIFGSDAEAGMRTQSRTNQVVVIEFAHGLLNRAFTFEETQAGNEDAEAEFARLCMGNEVDQTDVDIEAALDDGYYSANGHEVILTHS